MHKHEKRSIKVIVFAISMDQKLWNKMKKFYEIFICESDTNSGMWNRLVAYISIKLFFIIKLLFVNVYKFFL